MAEADRWHRLLLRKHKSYFENQTPLPYSFPLPVIKVLHFSEFRVSKKGSDHVNCSGAPQICPAVVLQRFSLISWPFGEEHGSVEPKFHKK